MTETSSTENAHGEKRTSAPVGLERWGLLQLPGLVAIGLYLAALAMVIVIGVVGRNYPPLFLIFAVLFLAATGGLMLMLRWAWALALAAVLLLAIYNSWIFSSEHLGPALVQGLLNWVFFLYMIRVEVRSKLR